MSERRMKRELEQRHKKLLTSNSENIKNYEDYTDSIFTWIDDDVPIEDIQLDLWQQHHTHAGSTLVPPFFIVQQCIDDYVKKGYDDIHKQTVQIKLVDLKSLCDVDKHTRDSFQKDITKFYDNFGKANGVYLRLKGLSQRLEKYKAI